MSVEKCRASASRAWLLYFFATFIKCRERKKSTKIDVMTTANAQKFISNPVSPQTSLSMASQTTQTQVSSSRPASTSADRFSTFPCPNMWSLSAGLSEILTANHVIAAASRSSAECRASESMPKLPVSNPTRSLNAVSAVAATTESAAAKFFSSIKDDDKILPSPNIKQKISARAVRACFSRLRRAPLFFVAFFVKRASVCRLRRLKKFAKRASIKRKGRAQDAKCGAASQWGAN